MTYNLEWAGGRFHSDAWFALAWGGFPVLTSYFAQTGAITAPVVLIASACVLLSLGQRRLSTPARLLRRRVIRCEGRLTLDDGTEIALNIDRLRGVPEGALRAHWIGLALLAAGLLAWRMILTAGPDRDNVFRRDALPRLSSSPCAEDPRAGLRAWQGTQHQEISARSSGCRSVRLGRMMASGLNAQICARCLALSILRPFPSTGGQRVSASTQRALAGPRGARSARGRVSVRHQRRA